MIASTSEYFPIFLSSKFDIFSSSGIHPDPKIFLFFIFPIPVGENLPNLKITFPGMIFLTLAGRSGKLLKILFQPGNVRAIGLFPIGPEPEYKFFHLGCANADAFPGFGGFF